MCLLHRTTEKDPQAREPSKCLNGQSKEKDWPKRPSDCQLPEAQKKKDSDWAITPVVEAVCVPTHLVPPASWLPKQVLHLHARPSLGQSCHRQTKDCLYAHRVSSVVSNSLRPCELWPAGLSGGFSRQEYWNVLIHTSCHTLLEHYISCCPSRQLP